jgi:hypothetical protein
MRRLLEMQIFSIAKLDFFPLRYLGVPIAASRLHVVDWAKMLEKGVKKLDIWQGDSLSIAGRTTLALSILLSITCLCTCSLKQWVGDMGWRPLRFLDHGITLVG